MTAHVSGAHMPPPEKAESHGLDHHSHASSDTEPATVEDSTPTPTYSSSQSPNRPPPYQSLAYHRYRTSTSTSSATSSPTTTASLLGPPSSSETPGTSPDTPGSASPYGGPFHQTTTYALDGLPEKRFGSISNTARRLKNPKNLALNNLASSNGAHVESPPVSADSQAGFDSPGLFSPSFVKPAPPRRKSTAPGLTIQTPSSDTFSAAQQPCVVPPTPRLLRPIALRQFQSTPSLPLPTAHFSSKSVDDTRPAIPQFTSNLTNFPVDETDELREPEGKVEGSEAYPDGPICIYEPHVDLYFEPTAEEAARYDVIFNVASEVRNPFLEKAGASYKIANIQDAVAALSGDRAFSVTLFDAERAGSPSGTNDHLAKTEYIHIPWEHNSNIVPGDGKFPPLHDIVRIIDDRVISGKRVLIHCQCGVSRSASLIVAYGLYKTPNITVQEAYDLVKQKSKWIGPNMGLIMQLQEYRNVLSRASSALKGHQKSTSKVLHGRKDLDDPFASASSVPQTAPLPQESSPLKRVPSPIETENMPDVSAGPSSAPSDLHWPSNATLSQFDEADTSNSTTPRLSQEKSYVSATGQIVHDGDSRTPDTAKAIPRSLEIRTDVPDSAQRQASIASIPLPPISMPLQQPLESPRSAEFAMSPLRAADDDPTFGITSPREAALASSPNGMTPVQRSPFARSPLQDLPMAPIGPPDDDITLGLTSPRGSSFTSQMPHYFDQPPHFVPLRPLLETNPSDTHARAALGSRLGFSSHRSEVDLRADQSPLHTGFSAKADSMRHNVSGIQLPDKDEPDFADALMSPRATEFTISPFQDALEAAQNSKVPTTSQDHVLASVSTSAKSDALAKPTDPRSPPLKGSSPINRNILDVFDSPE